MLALLNEVVESCADLLVLLFSEPIVLGAADRGAIVRSTRALDPVCETFGTPRRAVHGRDGRPQDLDRSLDGRPFWENKRQERRCLVDGGIPCTDHRERFPFQDRGEDLIALHIVITHASGLAPS